MPRRRSIPPVHVCECAACRSGAESATRRAHQQMNLFLSRLDERQRRWYAALEAQRLGHGGTRQLARITGLSVKTIRRGRRELETELRHCPIDRVRQPGGGRPPVEVRDPALERALEAIVDPETAGDPQRATKSKRSSLRQLSARLREQQHPVSHTTVGRLLKQKGLCVARECSVPGGQDTAAGARRSVSRHRAAEAGVPRGRRSRHQC